MLYYKFDNYNHFKELFGMVQHGNGVKSRKNKILLSYLKCPAILHEATITGNKEMLDVLNMQELKNYALTRIQSEGASLGYEVKLMNYTFGSNTYETDGFNGITEDGDVKAIRYLKHDGERSLVYKMKAGKFFRAIITETSFGKMLPEQVIVWLTEEFVMDWEVYSSSFLPKNKLYVNQDFSRIYDSTYCSGDFGSCMMYGGLHSFYKDYINISAAYLQDDEGNILA